MSKISRAFWAWVARKICEHAAVQPAPRRNLFSQDEIRQIIDGINDAKANGL